MDTLRFRFGRYLLDPQARELFRDDERLVLPVSHIDCLIYLVQHRDRPVGRDELAAVVWDRADVSDVSLSHDRFEHHDGVNWAIDDVVVTDCPR